MTALKVIGTLMCVVGFGGSCSLCAMAEEGSAPTLAVMLGLGLIGFFVFVIGRFGDK